MILTQSGIVGLYRDNGAKTGVLNVLQLVEERNDVLQGSVQPQQGPCPAGVVLLLVLDQIMINLKNILARVLIENQR